MILKRTLYGLKRSPRHWFDKCTTIFQSLGLHQCPNSPCLFTGTIIPGRPPIYIGLYVDDCIYYSTDPDVEKEFETRLADIMNNQISFMGTVTHFLGIKFDCIRNHDNNLNIYMSQTAFIDSLVHHSNLSSTNSVNTPYRSGYPVDTIPEPTSPSSPQQILQMRQLLGSLQWLSQCTRPDIATITNLLAQYQSNPSQQHIDAAKRVIKYLKGTSTMGIRFEQQPSDNITAFVKFPICHHHPTAMSDANWGPQDQSRPTSSTKHQCLPLFKTRSLSGYIIFLANGPITWSSKRQKITARSSAEAEIYATDECTKCIQILQHLRKDLQLPHHNTPIPIYNDNQACVLWSRNSTTKGLRHIQIKENATRECIQNNTITISHIEGKVNPSDLFTKEDKDPQHFISIRNLLLYNIPTYGSSIKSPVSSLSP